MQNEKKIVSYVMNCKQEAASAKSDRLKLNRDNYDMYHLKHDFSHKKSGQSMEVLSKQKMAVEQIRSFFQQALVDIGDWWNCEAADGSEGEGMLLQPHEIYKLTNHMLQKANFYSHVGNCVQSALLGALAIPKVHGCMKTKPKFVARKKGRGKGYRKWVEAVEDKTWELKLDIIRQEDYYPDPTGNKLYEIEECELDMHEVRKLAEYGYYDKAAIADLQAWGTSESDGKKARETGQNAPAGNFRPRVKITEFWGTVVDEETGDILHENVVITIANETTIIRKPTPNPLWHQRTPIVAAALLEVTNSVWHTALMDAATKHNRSLIEIFNLILDAGMKSVHGINQIRMDDLEDPKQITDGIPFGTNLKVRSSLPPGAKVMEPVVTGDGSPQALNILNVLQQEFNASALTNDLRQGVMPFRAVKATEVVEASNTITSVFSGVAKNVETKLIAPQLELSWMTIAQNLDLISKEELQSIFGAERGEQISQLEPEDVFVQTVNGVKFRVFGISLTMSKQADFRKLTTLLQTVSGSEILIEAFLQKYSFQKWLGEVMTALDIDKHKLEEAPANQGMIAGGGGDPAAALEQGAAPGASPDGMSQVPSAGSGSLSDIFAGQTGGGSPYPGSPAVAGQGG